MDPERERQDPEDMCVPGLVPGSVHNPLLFTYSDNKKQDLFSILYIDLPSESFKIPYRSFALVLRILPRARVGGGSSGRER